MHVRRHSLLAAAIGLALSSSLPATAQQTTAASTGSVELGEIIVTARRREEALKDVPIAVTVLGGALLNERQIYAVKDVAAYAPGLNINSDSIGRAFVSIRGVGTTLIDSVQPGVGIFFDGVYQPNTSYLNSPIVDVERIEVLRGPQGTLFGNNTLGGAINVITRQPGDEFEGKATAAYADPDNFQSASLSLSGPIVPGTLQGKIGAAYHRHDGFMKNILIGGDANPLDQKSARATLRWEPADGAEITLNSYYDRVKGATFGYQWLDGPTDYTLDAQTNVNSRLEFTYKGASLKGVFDLGAIDSSLTLIAAYDKRDQRVEESDGDYGPIDFLRARGTGDLETKTGEIRLDTDFGDGVSTLFGIFASKSTNKLRSTTTLVPLALTIPSASDATSDFFGVFGNVFWKLGEDWELAAGIRYDHQKVDVSTAAVEPYTADEWEPRVTLTRHWSPDTMTYASIARGFRGGGQNGPGSPNPIYKGDSVWTYELGAKTLLLDQRLSLDTAIFYNDYRDFIGQNALAPSTTGVGFVAINLNTGDVKSYGLEVESSLAVTDRFHLNASLTLLHARITDETAFVETTGYGLPSDRILFLPDWNYSLGASYTLPLSSGRDSLEFALSAVGKGTRVGSGLALVQTGPLEMDSYSLVNAAVTYRRQNLEVALFGINLFEDKYLESYIDSSLLLAAGLGALSHDIGIQGERRRIGLRATYRF
jgi:iron complex outermembrane receptor protein